MNIGTKVLDIGGGLILRESLRSVDRVRNVLQVLFSVEPLFGEVYSSSLANKISTCVLIVSASRNSAAWTALKDTSQQGFVKAMSDLFTKYLQAWVDFKAWDADPQYIETEPSVPLGAPERSRVPFDRQAVIDELHAGDTNGSLAQLLDLLLSLGVTSVTLKVV